MLKQPLRLRRRPLHEGENGQANNSRYVIKRGMVHKVVWSKNKTMPSKADVRCREVYEIFENRASATIPKKNEKTSLDELPSDSYHPPITFGDRSRFSPTRSALIRRSRREP